MPPDFHHVLDPQTRAVLDSDPLTIRPSFIRAAARETLAYAECDLLDPDVHNAVERLEIAEGVARESDAIKAHSMLRRFWSI